MENHPLIRKIYLYGFALLGLVLLVIGSVGFVNMGLKAFVFTHADEYQRQTSKQFPYPACGIEKYATATTSKTTLVLTEEEKATFTNFLVDYKNWKDSPQIDYVTSQRHQDAAMNLALILIGLPLYLYHWIVIKRENK